MATSSTSSGKVFIIEHMEADDNTPASLPPWVLLEYTHILTRTYSSASPNNTVYFTNLSPKSASALTSQLSSSSSSSEGRSKFVATAKSVMDLIEEGTLPSKEKICLLDPRAEKVIGKGDREEFDAFLFGGILGDDPPRDRTKELRKLGFPGRHLGEKQMTTDTAVYVTHLVVDEQKTLDSLPYLDFPTIQFNEQESVEMPFRYVKDAETGQPTMPVGMKDLLYKDMDKGFEEEDL